MEKKLPLKCPSCENAMKVVKLHCDYCETEVSGVYDMPILSKLSIQEQRIIIDFVKASGSLKLMASKLGLSYPTVRNLFDDIIEKINEIDK